MTIATDTIGSRTFGITARGMRQAVDEAHKRAFDTAIQDIERKIVTAARRQEWGVVLNMFYYEIEPEDMDTIFDLLENRGFVVDDKHKPNSRMYEVYVTWDDEYVRD